MQHHFKHICTDVYGYVTSQTLREFLTVAKHQSLEQTYYASTDDDPDRGSNKYFGDAFEAFVEILLDASTIDKRINCTNFVNAPIDEFGIDGQGMFTKNNSRYGKLLQQSKAASNPHHYYNSGNSNILSAVAALAVMKGERLLFITSGAGISPALLTTLNQQDPQLVVQLTYKDLCKFVNGNTTFWKTFNTKLLTP